MDNNINKEIIDTFDFENVHKAMTLLNWKWWFSGEEDRVPTLEELKEQADKMLNDARNGCPYSTGGFSVTEHNGNFTLSFEIESSFGR